MTPSPRSPRPPRSGTRGVVIAAAIVVAVLGLYCVVDGIHSWVRADAMLDDLAAEQERIKQTCRVGPVEPLERVALSGERRCVKTSGIVTHVEAFGPVLTIELGKGDGRTLLSCRDHALDPFAAVDAVWGEQREAPAVGDTIEVVGIGEGTRRDPIQLEACEFAAASP